MPPRHIEDVPVAEQPDMLDRASLEFCLADAFHPGCEMTWPMRTAGLYMAPFRIAHAAPGWIEPEYGPTLGAYIINLPNGPVLGGQLPGWDHPLDGSAVADRHGQLPVRISEIL